MRGQGLKLVGRPATRPALRHSSEVAKSAPSLGQTLRKQQVLTSADLLRAQAASAAKECGLGEYLVLNRLAEPEDILNAHMDRLGAARADLENHPPENSLIDRVGAERCLRHRAVPWKSLGYMTVIAVADPDRFVAEAPFADANFGHIVIALANEDEIFAAVEQRRARYLVARAEARTDSRESCRDWPIAEVRRVAIGVSLALLGLALFTPSTFVALILAWAMVTLLATIGLKLAAAYKVVRDMRPSGVAEGANARALGTRPVVSILVPLLAETELASTLIHRLGRLEYPRELMDIIFVVEASDVTTHATLRRTQLPRRIRIVTVPPGSIRTKPRALNYALDFCRGSIVGVYDAEDAPDPDQIARVVEAFQTAPPEVACVQGTLDYYNARTNWLARCFTIEYATWFRMLLPGLERLGLPVPLGGTTVFFRRAALESLGAWDAHNVTEDADLGLRLARHGFKTKVLPTVTREEANCHPWAWIKQRSRWLKGYAVTYCVHMRAPRQLWHDLGPRRFLGAQIIFLGTLSQFLLAPILWLFWPAAFGLWHPFQGALPPLAFQIMVGVFLASEVISLSISMLAVRSTRHCHLLPWVLTLPGYFPLAVVAAFKGVAELTVRPFHWEKTRHGQTRATEMVHPAE